MTYSVSSPAGILSTIPVMLGKYPANSVVAMTVNGNALGATLRVDKPAVMDEAWMGTFTGYLAKANGEQVILAMFSADHHGIAMLPLLADYLTTHLPVTIALQALVTPEYWVDLDFPEARRPALEIEANPTFMAMVANGDDTKNVHTLPVLTEDAVFRRDVAEHFGEWVIAEPVLHETWNMYLGEEGVGTPTRTEAVEIMAAMAHGGLRDALLCKIFLATAGLADYGTILLGTHPAPFDRARYERGLALLKHLATLDAPPTSRAAVLAGLGWLHWHAGRGSAANEALTAALEVEPGHRLASLLHEVIVKRSLLSPLATVKDHWVNH